MSLHLRAKSLKYRGFSLIELMIAILLGTILIGGAASLYIGSKRSYTEVEQVAALAENARFSVAVLENSLLHAGFFGPSGPGNVLADGNLDIPVVGDCADIAAAYDVTNPFFGFTADAVNPTLPGGNSINCIDDALVGTDLLVVKQFTPQPFYDADPRNPAALRDGVLDFPSALSATQTYAVANSEGGLIFDGADGGPSVAIGEVYANATAFPYEMNIYYVRNTGGVPALARKTLQWDATAGAMAVVTQDLAEGVENMQLLFGLDQNADGEPDTYVNQAGVVGPDQWASVIAVRAFLLVQSVDEDPGYTDNRSFQLGDVAVVAANDNRRRVLARANITLRNPRLRIRGGA